MALADKATMTSVAEYGTDADAIEDCFTPTPALDDTFDAFALQSM
jgi:hypothetical protein